MKKLLLSIAFLSLGFTSFAQSVALTQDWALKVGVSPLITATANSSVAYNKVTDHLYLVDRNVKISILKTDGTLASPSALPLPVGGFPTANSYKYTKVRVTDDGVIYAIGMITAAGNVPIYRWASETDVAPTEHLVAAPGRSGESFAISGTGNNTTLYMSGSGSTAVTVAKVTMVPDPLGLAPDQPVVTKEFDIPVTANHARGSISFESAGSIWINTPNSGATFETRRVNFNTTTGAFVTTDIVPAGKIDWVHANTEYFADGTKKFLVASGAVIGSAAAPANLGLTMKLYDITSGFATPVLRSSAEMFPYVAPTPGPAFPVLSSNGNGYGDVAFKRHADASYTFFHVVFGSGLSSYTTVTVLPVSLTSFNASLVNGQSTLAWSTASEKNNKGFEVLRSTDGKNFSSVGFVASKGQNGNATTALDYSFVDRTAAAGVNYYQLNQVDLDGKSELSKDVVSVNVSLSADAITVYPNPVTTYVNVSTGGLDFNGYQYDLFDVNGKKVLSAKATSGEQQISLSGLAPSIYYLRVSKDNVPQNTVKLIKK